MTVAITNVTISTELANNSANTIGSIRASSEPDAIMIFNYYCIYIAITNQYKRRFQLNFLHDQQSYKLQPVYILQNIVIAIITIMSVLRLLLYNKCFLFLNFLLFQN